MTAAVDADVGATIPRLRLLVLQPTPYCNIDCAHCNRSNRASTAMMSLATLALVCRRVFESPLLGRELEVAWHGGEPLTVPLAWYETAVAFMAQRRPAALRLNHCFQTNGLLLDKDWARFLARTKATIGLGIDGPADLHDANRRTRAGQGTHDRAMQTLRLLQDTGLAFHVITVLTQRALDDPDRLFDFYVGNGIKEVGFNIEEIEGACRASRHVDNGIEAKFRKFIRRFFELACDAPGRVKVRELETTVGAVLSAEPATDEQDRPSTVLSVSPDGAISTFPPEPLGARHARFGSLAFGEVASRRPCDLADAPSARNNRGELKPGGAACERGGEDGRGRGGGQPANKRLETGRFDAPETMHCRLTRQAMLDEVVAGMAARIGRLELPRDQVSAGAF